MLYFNGKPLTVGYFPNKELYLDTDFLERQYRHRDWVISLRFESNDDLIALALLKGQMDDMGFENVTLFCPFFPYSTMDHVEDNTRPLSLKYVAQFINRLNFKKVSVWEPHSTVLAALVDRLDVYGSKTMELFRIAMDYLPGVKDPVICFPDLGAEKRYVGNCGDYHTLTFQKVRDFSSGKITGMRCVDDISAASGKTCILLDDLCRGGRTFIGCAELLKEAGAQQVILCVTHMEQGAFNGVLKDGSPVDKVYATNTCLPCVFPIPLPNKLYLESAF